MSQATKTAKINNTKDSQSHLRQTAQDKLVPNNKGSAAKKGGDSRIRENSSTGKGNLKDTNRMRSAGQRVTPAHVSAPFQTNTRLTNSKLKTEYSATTGKVVTSARQSANFSVRVKGTLSAPSKRPVSKDSDKQQVTVSNKVVAQKDSGASPGQTLNVNCEPGKGDVVDKLTDANSLQVQIDSPGHADITDTKNSDGVSSDLNELHITESQISREENAFTLSKDGYGCLSLWSHVFIPVCPCNKLS